MEIREKRWENVIFSLVTYIFLFWSIELKDMKDWVRNTINLNTSILFILLCFHENFDPLLLQFLVEQNVGKIFEILGDACGCRHLQIKNFQISTLILQRNTLFIKGLYNGAKRCQRIYSHHGKCLSDQYIKRIFKVEKIDTLVLNCHTV